MGIEGPKLAPLLRFTAPAKVIRYLAECAENSRLGIATHNFQSLEAEIAGFWADYLTNCALLDYDMKNSFILFPMT
jgi:hypothetical protein